MCVVIAALIAVVVWAADPVGEGGGGIKPPPVIQKMMKVQRPPLKPGMKQNLFNRISQKQKALEDTEEKGAPTGKANTGSVYTTDWMQNSYEASTLKQLNTLQAIQPSSDDGGGLQALGHLSFQAPFADWNRETNLDAGCWGTGTAGPNAGTVFATGSSYSISDYKRAEVFVWVEAPFTAPKTGEMTVTIEYTGLHCGLVVGMPTYYQNLSRSSLYGFICYPATGTWEQELKTYAKVPPPAILSVPTAPGEIVTLELPKVQVTQGEAVLIGAGLRQYDRSRWNGITAGSIGGVVYKINVDIE